MFHNKLKLNPDKTEFLLIGHKSQRNKFSELFPTTLLDNSTMPSDSAKNLGVLFDQDMSFSKYVTQTCRSCYYHIRNLKMIRKHLSLSDSITIGNALVTSKLDYCNSLLTGIAQKDLNKLQRVQNCLARVITKSPRFTSSAPLLKSLHWLPVKSRISFKLNLITFKTLLCEQPSYLSQYLTIQKYERNLRTNENRTLHVPKYHTKTGSRAFCVAAPVSWNTLPIKIRLSNSIITFRKQLKTHLFRIACPP